MTIGERLEEARKRRGISVREAAEATKIRGDFLLAMEGNSMDDINLPDIYRRGFLKNYGKFLRIDADKLLTDYDALQLGSAKYDKRLGTTPPMETQKRNRPAEAEGPQAEGGEASRSNFGRMEIGGAKEEKRQAPKSSPRAERGTQPADAAEIVGTSNRGLYIKVGLLFGVGFLLVVLIFFLISLLRSDPAPEINPDLASPNTTEAPANSGSSTTQSAQTEQVVLEALDNVTVIVNESPSGEEIFRGTLIPGERQVLQKRGSLVLRYSNGSALNVSVDGRQAQLNDGVGSARLK